ncbi:hypothetical protein [Actinomadura rupiterrae]|uniref:hypothetical protein n=1 Tax=Actinomadura rupiterrae TaxID=559627 RepID=UPI0020A42773|nr:hypothetical protein [Actinomadura rupiterrae]MCP2340170.1 hypothetical protein [Actinomadura rupiterrae]
MTRHNGRPILLASSMPPHQLSLPAGRHPTMVCPDCGTWRVWRRGMLLPHKDGARRCAGSNQRIRIDLSPALWQALLVSAVAETSTRRSRRQFSKPALPVAPALHQIASVH